MTHHKRNPLKGLIFGLAGGVAGTYAMGLYWQAVQSITGKDPRKESSDDGPDELDDFSLVGQQHEEGESSTAAAGRVIAETFTGDEPDDEEKEALSNSIHWGYGTLIGGVYGLLRGGTTRVLDLPGGVFYGAAAWLLGSEIAVPMLGLSSGPSTQTKEAHAHGLAAHIVYGLAAAAVTQLLYKLTTRK